MTKGVGPTPPSPPRSHEDKAGWQRRFTWNVDQLLRRSIDGKTPLTPEEAGIHAREQTRNEYRAAYPNVGVAPEWLP